MVPAIRISDAVDRETGLELFEKFELLADYVGYKE